MSFKIPFDFEEAKKTNILAVGDNACGKTLLACGIAHNLMERGYRVIVFDNSLAWLHKSDVPYYQLIKSIDTPIYLNGESIIYEIGYLRPSESRELVDKITWDIWNRQLYNPSRRILLIYEEAENYLARRSQKVENILRAWHTGRNILIRCLGVSTDIAMFDTSLLRQTRIRYYGRIVAEENVKRKMNNTHGKDWTYTMQHLDVGSFVYYHNGKLEVISIPEFKTTTRPKPISPPKPKKPKGIIERIKEAFSTEPTTPEQDTWEQEDDEFVEELDTSSEEEEFIPL